MSNINTVNNSAPGHPLATYIDSLITFANSPKPGLPPGSTGAQPTAYTSELSKGNLGGIEAARGAGINIEYSG